MTPQGNRSDPDGRNLKKKTALENKRKKTRKNTQKRNEKTRKPKEKQHEKAHEKQHTHKRNKKTTRETQRKTTREAALTSRASACPRQPRRDGPKEAAVLRPPARRGARVAISAFKEAPRVTRGRAVACMASGSAALLPVYSSTHPPASPTSIPLPERLSPRLPVRFSFLLLPCLSTCHPSPPLHIPKRPAWLLAIRPCRPTYLSGPVNQPYVHPCLFIYLYDFIFSLTPCLCLHSHL